VKANTRTWVPLLAAAATACAGDQTLLSKDQIVRATRGSGGQPLELLWARTDRPWQGQEFFVTVHGRDSGSETHYSAAVYRRTGVGFTRLAELRSDSSSFLEPTASWAAVAGSNARERLIGITEILPGTGNLRQEHLFVAHSSGDLISVELVSAATAFAPRLRPGEGVWKGEENSFGDAGLAFTFYIWKEGDANCCPSAGKVTGTYTLEERDGRYRVVAHSFRREPVASR